MRETIEAALADFLGRGGGLALIMLTLWLAPSILTSYRPEDIPEQYR